MKDKLQQKQSLSIEMPNAFLESKAVKKQAAPNPLPTKVFQRLPKTFEAVALQEGKLLWRKMTGIAYYYLVTSSINSIHSERASVF